MASRTSSRTLLIAGGGTGGHLFPGVAVAEEWLSRGDDHKVAFAGTERGIEARIVPELGHPLHLINVSGLKTVGLFGALRGAMRIPRSIRQSKALLQEVQPCAVIGVGGYASGPVVLAAKSFRLPRAILEQNSIPGLTNRILGRRYAQRIFLSFQHSASFFPAAKSELIGNPIRRQILAALQGEQPSSNSESARRPLRLFIFGGSQGAVAVNGMCIEAARRLKDEGIELEIVHQTGERDFESTRAKYENAGVDADCRAFINDMATEYRNADLIVSRAGATTIAELGVVGRPAILIPYPYAANNHQVLNAQEMVDAGGAIMLEQGLGEAAAGDGQRLFEALKPLCQEAPLRASMSEKVAAFGRPDAAKKVVDWIVSAASFGARS